MPVLLLIYILAGWWAANRTIYANRVIVGQWNAIAIQKFIVALFLGWILIPVALIKLFFRR